MSSEPRLTPEERADRIVRQAFGPNRRPNWWNDEIAAAIRAAEAPLRAERDAALADNAAVNKLVRQIAFALENLIFDHDIPEESEDYQAIFRWLTQAMSPNAGAALRSRAEALATALENEPTVHSADCAMFVHAEWHCDCGAESRAAARDAALAAWWEAPNGG